MWKSLLGEKIDNCVPIMSNARKRSKLDLPCIVNMVSTVSILPAGYRLPLEALSMRLGPCSQYSPMQFAANIIRVTNSTADTTTLIFGTGKLVVVSGRTEMHTCYMSHYMRLLVEEVLVNCAPSGGTIYKDHITHNIVGSGELGCTINLQAFRDANASSVKYLSDSFPAAKASVWITEDQECHCGHFCVQEDLETLIHSALAATSGKGKRGKSKCACTVKCLIFKTGRIVLIGAHNIEDIRRVFLRMKATVHDFHKLGSMLQKRRAVEHAHEIKEKKHVPSQSETIALALEGARAGKRTTHASSDSLHPLLKLSDAGRLAEVQMTLAMEPEALVHATDEYGRTAAQRLLSVAERTREQEEVLAFLLAAAAAE